MVLTATQAKAAYQHVIENVLGKQTDSPLSLALKHDGLDNLYAFLNINDADIDDLKYDKPDGSATDVKVNKGDKQIICIFHLYIKHRSNSGNPINDDWLSVTKDMFNEYRSITYFSHASAPMSSTTSSSTSSMSTHKPPMTPVEIFCRGVKCNPSLFPVLKDECYNAQWHRAFLNQARAQNVDKVLDPTYSPTSQAEKDLLEDMNKYMFAVLDSTVLTDQGKSFIREHDSDFNAQEVYKKLLEHHTKSTKASMTSSQLLSYITSARLGTGEWKGTTEAFITNWKNQVKIYERQVDTNDKFLDHMKKIMLQNAVFPIEEL